MAQRILLIGRTHVVVDNARSVLAGLSEDISTATCLDEVRSTFGTKKIDHVFMGAGIDIDARLEIVREIYRQSDNTSVHLKDSVSGPKGFLPFVKSVLVGSG